MALRNRRKFINSNKRKVFFALFFLLLFISVGYAYLSASLSINGQVVLKADPTISAGNLLQKLKNSGETCITKYEGQVTDTVGVTQTATNVYFNNCDEKREMIFGGYCWRVIRTTETGGLKILYNGEPVNGKCESTRGDHLGIQAVDVTTDYLDNTYLYGDSFTYNTSTGVFTLTDTFTATWSDYTYEDLIGKYSCKNLSGTCTTITSVNGYQSDWSAYVSTYNIDTAYRFLIGVSPFNAMSDNNFTSIASVGYMFNPTYTIKTFQWDNSNFMVGSSFSYDANTDTYTLAGDIGSFGTDYNSHNTNKKYTCFSTNVNATCNEISYIMGGDPPGVVSYYRFGDGKNISDILLETVLGNSVNRYSSSIKGIIEAWYKNNLEGYTSKIEDVVYCNDRSIDVNMSNIGPGALYFTPRFRLPDDDEFTPSLKCENITDQFSISNSLARTTYPIGLSTGDEMGSVNDFEMDEWAGFLTATPSDYAFGYSQFYYAASGGVFNDSHTDTVGGIRPMISLRGVNLITSGSGTESDPWIVN